jgi:hypothetical protein
MTFSSGQIEQITQSVLRELRSRGVVVAADRRVSDAPQASANGQVVLQHRVITEDILAEAGVAGRSVTIPAGAVITPSGHDYIRRHQVTIASGVSGKSHVTAGVLVCIGTASSVKAAAGSAKWTTVAAGCERDAAKKIQAEALAKPVVCCGGEPSAVACLLNRDAGLRVAVISRGTDIDRLMALMNPQAVCLDATGWSFAELVRLFRQLGMSGNTVPSGWKELAGGRR